MKIYISCDHRGLKMKNKLVNFLYKNDIVPIDLGPKTYKADDDYNEFVETLCKKVTAEPDNRGIFVCGSGIGPSIAANRHNGIRCVTATRNEIVKDSRAKNDTNVLSLSADLLFLLEAQILVTTFLTTPFEGGRHKRRVDKLDK